ncbi:MAG: hypothetical protein HOP33_19400 [Verrucomicrobia bacterium]|nr:hypothetical protein [Verrucomicrobiota bacterium]
MKNSIIRLALVAMTAMAASLNAATITVNTADNTNFGAGQTNLVTAINLLADGDTIRFNIPGAGPHYLVSPVGGYPAITNKHNVTIDGYTQPGSSPNTNPILAANNANIKIVLTATNGELTVLDIPGYGTGESAVLFLYGSTNFTVKGICLLGPGGPEISPSPYAVSFAFNGADAAHGGHVAGCRIGLDLDGTTIARFKDAVTGFGPGPINGTVVGVKAGPADSAAARAQFNIIMAMHIPVILEGNNYRICGNFINVYPNGLQDFIADGTGSGPDHTLEAFMEFGGNFHHSLLVGTDGDGLNDAEERNIFGGVTFANDSRLFEWYSGGAPRTNIVIAGNYIGVGVDGVTRFTNSIKVFDGFNSTATVQFGSDLNGISDTIEGNLISMNHPFGDPALGAMSIFGNLSTGTRLSLRGNSFIGINNPPYSWADGTGGRLTGFTNYSAPYMDVASPNGIIPTLAATNTYPTLSGTFAPGIGIYTNITIDVYQLDPEGWENGKTLAWSEMQNPDSSFNGFSQGKKYVGTIAVPNTGSFSVNASGLDFGLGAVTVTVNYSADPAGTTKGRVHTSNFSTPVNVLPGGASSVGLTHVVNDVALWYNGTGSYATNGFVNLAQQTATLGNWEPYIDVLGDSTFLVGFNTFADDQNPPAGATIDAPAPFQRFAVAFQPAAGGAAKIGEHFYTDAGAPYRGPVNYRRQNGNPQRVAGDKRFGAANFITAGESSLGQHPSFQSPARWGNNPSYLGANAYVTVQTHSLDTATLTQTPISKAIDPLYGNFVTAIAPVTQTQVSRTGGRPVVLDNGNMVVVSDDRTGYLDPDGELSSFSIITPSGTEVKSATLVSLGDQWDNVAAFKGGFAVRPAGGLIYFYDNAGTLLGSVNHNTSSGLTFDTGRGDGTRTASDIRSHYVYIAGPSGGQIWVAAWDANTQAFVGKARVDDQAVGFTIDRTAVAVDALDRLCVAYIHKPTVDFANQIAARVLSFDGANFSYLTHSFFPFVNYDPDGILSPIGDFITGAGPTVAMTTREICIAAKMTLNNVNDPALGGNTAPETTAYTVISHPAPVAAPRPTATMTKTGSNLNISWNPDHGLFTVQTRSSLTSASWANATAGNVTTPVTIPAGSGPLYVRLAR